MRFVIIIFGILLILAGLSLVVDPKIVFDFLSRGGEQLGVFIAAIGVRLILGFFLIRTANASRYPMAIRIFGYLFIFAALLIIFMGRESFEDLISVVIAEFRPIGRIGGLLGMALGGFFVYAFTAKRKDPTV